MRWSDVEKSALVEANRDEYGNVYRVMDFISAEEADELTEQRAALLQEIADLGGTTICGGTKLNGRGLSPGCARCAEGSWSCLFINGQCNASCFYCPAPQGEVGQPTTNRLTFETPEDFGAYLTRFRFKGASLSGGEPLTTMDRAVAYLSAARDALGADGHLWLYSNGKLADEARLRRLAAAGLDELRLDLGAVDYHLEKVSLAVRLIPTVTVEIPAVPGELDRLRPLTEALARLGVRHLNLHQLRATPYNVGPLIERQIVLQHGPKVLAARSEITALAVLAHTLRRGVALPVNYCSFVYKHSHQAAAARRRAAVEALREGEAITATGHIRQLTRSGDVTRLGYLAASIEPGEGEGDSLPIPLPSGRVIHVRRRAAPPRDLTPGERHAYESLMSTGRLPEGATVEWSAIRDCEWLPDGLYEYF